MPERTGAEMSVRRSNGPPPTVIMMALTVLVFLRTKVGARLLNPGWIVIPAGALLVFCYAIPKFFGISAFDYYLQPENPAVGIFVVVFVARAFYLRSVHMSVVSSKSEGNWSSFNPGESFLGKGGRYWFLHRVVEPAVCLAVGYFILKFISWPLGLWVMASAFCLAIYEHHVYHGQLRLHFDMADTKTEGEIQRRRAGSSSGSPRAAVPDPDGEATGGLDDLEALRRSRRG